MRGLQWQTDKTAIQENKEPDEKVSIRKHNDCCLIVPDFLYSHVENFDEEN